MRSEINLVRGEGLKLSFKHKIKMILGCIGRGCISAGLDTPASWDTLAKQDLDQEFYSLSSKVQSFSPKQKPGF